MPTVIRCYNCLTRQLSPEAHCDPCDPTPISSPARSSIATFQASHLTPNRPLATEGESRGYRRRHSILLTVATRKWQGLNTPGFPGWRVRRTLHPGETGQ